MILNNKQWQLDNPDKCAKDWGITIANAKIKLIKQYGDEARNKFGDFSVAPEPKKEQKITEYTEKNKSGFIKISRDIVKSSVFDDSLTFKLFAYCIIRANWKKKEIIVNGEIIKLKPGEFLTSLDNLAKNNNTTVQKIRTRLKVLKLTRRLTSKTTNRFTIISLTNYDKYQTTQQANQQTNQQTDNKQITTDKNNKELIRRKGALNFLIYGYLTDDLKKKFGGINEFLQGKLKSVSVIEVILAEYYVFSERIDVGEGEFDEYLKAHTHDLSDLAIVKPMELVKIMRNLRINGRFSWDTMVSVIRNRAKKGAKSNKIDKKLNDFM